LSNSCQEAVGHRLRAFNSIVMFQHPAADEESVPIVQRLFPGSLWFSAAGSECL
jgi:hypothetical protein